MGIILSIVIGCLAGFCAGKLMKGGGFGFLMNLLLGLFGGALGGWIFSALGITWGGLLGQLLLSQNYLRISKKSSNFAAKI